MKKSPIQKLLSANQPSFRGGFPYQSCLRVALAGVILSWMPPSEATAASATWNQSSGGAWSTGPWTPAAAPGNTSSGATATTDTASFGTALTTTSSISVDAGRTIRGINFTNTVQLTIGSVAGNGLYLSDGGTLQKTSGGNYARINAPVRLVGSSTFTSSFNYLTFGGPISGSASGAHLLTLNGSAFTYFNQIEGIVSNGTGTVAITKSGSGLWSLENANTYTGATTVSAGTLLVNGSLVSGSAVSVASGATLGGNGSVGGLTDVDGSVAPGALNSSNVALIGTLTVTNDLTWNAGTDWKFQLDTTSGSSDLLALTGAGHDFLKGTGTDFNFNLLNTGVAGTFTLVDWTGTTTFNASDFTYSNLASGLSGTFVLNGSQLDFTVVAVPEPSTYALLGAGMGFLYILRRRSRSIKN